MISLADCGVLCQACTTLNALLIEGDYMEMFC
jgi:hypothetical protein